ncbi:MULTISPECIES: class I SAM-dependent methyltransferase [Cyanophyceae]|uniref:Class I SAM-dependent methyltransferase n=1 Tax=Leptolyngbya subtilissima DQ-A4 TaxID=2933933 RepID=A0ABV0JYA9_9CYAN|nr:class I SAM-dependent methyltransferase [Nodosilinea sp. FACHB-141]MBD2112144.1 class I SAM-dependent methyltransferase [Nodosilinea sp. FACHB-141]
MATQSKTLFEQFFAPIFSHLVDRDALLRLRDSIDWETGVNQFTNPQVVYPNYYKVSNFHGIKNGYLNVDAALTYDPITQYVLPPGENWVRESLVKAVGGEPRRILDLGCGTGTTTLMLKRRFPNAEVMGLDLSPQMLVMADYKAKAAAVDVTFRHGNAMATGLPAASFDMVCATLLFHETPPAVAKTILSEAFRLLTPGGQMLVLDGNQRTLRASDWLSTIFEEPFIRDYGQGNVDAWLGYAGFEQVRTEDVFWLNQLSCGRKPLPVAERIEQPEGDRQSDDLPLPQPA